MPNIPARVAKLGSEPVQQSRMARTFALRSEILGSRHQAPSEVLLPDPIDSDARRQRIVVREQPAGQFEPPGAGPRRLGQDTGRAGADFDAVPVPAAAHAQEGGLPLAILVDDARLATLRVRLVELLELAQRLGEAQLLALGRADDQTVGTQEVVRHHVGLAPGPSGRRDAHDLLPAVGVQAKFLPRQVVVQVHARGFAGLDAARFPVGLQGGHVVLVQDRLMLAPVLVDRVQVRAKLSLQRSVYAAFLEVVEESEQLVELPLRNGIVLVVVALGAAYRQAEPDRAERAGPVHGLFKRILGGVHAALSIAQGVAVEASGDALLDGRAGHQVAGDLLDREAVEPHPRIERVDHPASVPPRMRSDIILGIAVRVGVAHLVQPVHGLLLAKVLRGQQSLHHSLVGAFCWIFFEGALLLARRREPGQIQRDAGQQCVLVGLRCRLESFGSQALAHEVVDWIAPRRHVRPDDRLEGPVSRLALRGSGRGRLGPVRPRRPLIDPSPQLADLGPA